MRAIANPIGSRLVPALRYHNVAAAVDWLCGAFGFERHDIVTAVDGTILHARLMFGSDMILLLPVRSPDGLARALDAAGGEMQSCYFVVDDADSHYHHAKAAGAEILDITEYDYGGRGYSCRDPEGHLWTFGTYDPRQGQLPAVIEHATRQPSYWATVAGDLRLRAVTSFRSLGDKITPPVVVAAVVASIIAAATVGWLMVALPQSGVVKRLTFKSPAAPQRTEAVAAQPAPAPSPVNTLSVRPVAPQQANDSFERAVRQVEQPTRAPRPSHVNSPAFSAIGTEPAGEGDDDAKAEAERKAEQALQKLRAAQRNAGKAFRQLREASAESDAGEPPRKQAARTVPDPRELQVAREQLAREQQAGEQRRKQARERAAREAAAQLQEQFTRERAEKAAKEQGERARLSALTPPAKAPTSPSHDQKADSEFWDCQPNTATGQVVCNPAAKKPAAAPAEAKKPPPAPKRKVTAAEPAKAPAAHQPQEQKGGQQLWDCQPTPPTGEVVCHPKKQ